MSIGPYQEYKDVGVAWLGRIPAQWQIVQSRRLFVERKERARQFDEQLTASQQYGVIYQKDFMALKDQSVMQVVHGAEILKHVEPNDFVISMRSFQGGIEWCGLRGSTSSAYVVLIPSEKVVPSFFRHLLKSSLYIQALQSTTNLVRDGQALRFENFSLIDLPIVSEHEQRAIAAFLDRETAKIDALVEEQKLLIELLKEKRQAVISRAVTKGLDPNVPMKNSGVEWLGEVPEHWIVTRLKWLADLIDGDRSSAYPSDQDIVDEGVPFLSSKNIVGYKFCDLDLRFISPEKFASLSRGKIQDGDLAITVRGTIGHVAIYDAKVVGYPSAFINAQMMIIRPFEISALFMHLISESYYWQKQLDVAAYGTAQQQLSNEILRNIVVAVPPPKELDLISNFVVSELSRFDALVVEAQRAINLLQERRSALISATVTGKIDVRGLVEVDAPILDVIAA